jgi:hypothetical protein
MFDNNEEENTERETGLNEEKKAADVENEPSFEEQEF